MRRSLAAVALVAAMMTHAHAQPCAPADAIAPQAVSQGLEMVDFDGGAFDTWMAEVVARLGPPPSGKRPQNAIIIKRPGLSNNGARVVVVLVLPDGTACDYVSAVGPDADDVIRRVQGIAL